VKFDVDKFNSFEDKDKERILEIAHYALMNNRSFLECDLGMMKDEWMRLLMVLNPYDIMTKEELIRSAKE